MQMNLNLVAITIKNLEGEIVAIAKKTYKDQPHFEMLKKDSSLKIPMLYSDIDLARKSFRAKASKDAYTMDKKVGEFILSEYGLDYVEMLNHRDCRLKTYNELKTIVSFSELKVNFTDNLEEVF